MSNEIELAAKKERHELLTKVVSEGQAVFFIVGRALAEIKEKKTYELEGFKTFTEFCDKKWGFSQRHCNRLMIDAAVVDSLPEAMRELVKSDRAARELAKIPEVLRPAVVAAASEGGTKPVTKTSVKKNTPPVPPPRPASGKPSPTPPPPPSRKKTTTKPETPKATLDNTGFAIPDSLLPLWNRQHEAQELLTYTGAIIQKVERVRDEQDPLFKRVNFNHVLANLAQVKSDLNFARPHAVCPTCMGRVPDNCTLCEGIGLVSKFVWDTCVPEEIKAMRQSGEVAS